MKTLRSIYVASASQQYLLVERYVDQLRAQGFDIAYEWTQDLRESGFKRDAELSEMHRRYIARMASLAVVDCDLVWVLTPTIPEHGCGMWIEMGMALALNKPVVISGPLAERSVFSEQAVARHREHDDAFEYILKRADVS